MSKDLKLFNDFWNDVPSLFDRAKTSLFKGFSDEFDKILNGKCDFEETDDKYAVELELPGVKKDEIELNLKNDNLTISWSRKREKKEGLLKNAKYERSEGSFKRSFNVEGADSDKIEAELKNGILKINIPKLENVKAKQIQIKN